MQCDQDVKKATTLATIISGTPESSAKGFKAAIAEVQKQGRPLLIDMAEAAMDALGGATGLMERLTSDLKQMRGEGLTEEQRVFHDPDFKSIKGLYELIVKLAAERDKLVGTGDPLDGVSEEDLMVVASQAALLVIKTDLDFRQKILAEIIEIDPQTVVDAAMLAMTVLNNRPKVEVIDVTP